MGDAEQTLKLDLRDVVRASSERRPVLFVLQGHSLGMSFQLKDPRTVIGRGDVDFVLKDALASRQHAEVVSLTAQTGCLEYFVRDLGSTNGTFLNGSRVTGDRLLQDGDKIKVGEHLLKFAMLDDFEAEFQERLHQMIQRDELTGLMSRRSLFAELDREVGMARHSSHPGMLTVLMLDLDFFKRVNDAYGHLIGSQTIRLVGHIVRDAVGSADMAARYGGEEYFAYLRGSREEGVAVAERIRTAVECTQFPASLIDQSRVICMTISVGVASFPGDGLTAIEIVRKADQALYRAKMSGRNRTCIYDPSLDDPNPSDLMGDASAIIYGPADAQ